MPQAPLFVVLNHGSGSNDGRQTEQSIRQALTRQGREFSLFAAQQPTQLDALARQAVMQAQAVDGIVVVAGGDGTINAVTQAVLPSGLRFGVLPQGTFNFFGRCHGLPTGDAGAAVEALLAGEEKPVQVGMVNDRAFLVNASLGFYPELLEQREADKRRFGRNRLVAIGSGIRAMLGGYRRLTVELHGEGTTRRLRTITLVVGNNRLQLDQLGLAHAPQVEQGRLVGIVVRPVSKPRLLLMGAMGVLGRLGDAEHVESLAFESLQVRVPGHRQLKLALDGEIVHLSLPLHIRVAERPLRLLVPPTEARAA